MSHYIAPALVLLLALTGCSQSAPQSPESAATETKEEETTPRVPVETQQVSVDNVSAYYRTTALLEAPEEAQVVARVSGIIESLHVEEGQLVKAGEPLATIDPKRYRLALNKAQAELDVIDQELERLHAIANQQLVSQETLAKLEYRRQAALADRDIAALQLTYSKVSSPIDGVVAKRYVKRGKMAAEHEALFHIVQQETLHGILHLPERELSRIRIGQEAELTVEGLSEPQLAQVLRIAPVVDPETGTFKITLTLDNRAGTLKAGMLSRARVRFDTHHNTLVVPRMALVRQDLGQAVFVIHEGQAQSRMVEVGYEDGERVEILKGLEAGEQVVIRGQHQLKDEAQVEVIPSLQLAAQR
ncbi:efflux RND transporter periplasmic adaptor subunit [Ferrimonas balearica]|uniref:efflux RND transporter periplasmic adaptor subunit n=1 Tax=Ferrimonas balearica TaxID=44012 RepID=UPI001C99FB98|nr:efflux RND transporter periplasmic adaptor subunit [Ferrimonas balearica]MBY5922242.1 efflux RND transporter periplasmic adaptor subunit [Ferrimonas balearica]MBY5994418.1 efflux RND transporter periplasmic adaptor subunit [Ferrimonas balearica]